MQNAKLIFPPTLSKSSMIEEILCDARRQKRSIVDLCEHFGVRCTRAKFTNQNDFSVPQANFRLLHIQR